MFLKKINKFICLRVFVFFLFFSLQIQAENLLDKTKKDFANYIDKFNDFSSSFIQSDNKTIEEGFLYIKNKRIRLDYNKPSQITIIIAHNKAMYFNKDLNEVEYFNPEKSIANLLYKFFYEKGFVNDAIIISKNHGIIIKKEVLIEKENSEVRIFFENNPLIIRRLEFENKNYFIKFAIMDSNFNSNLNKKIFSMINPLIN